MQYLVSALSALLSVALMFAITRLTGSRQLSSMTVYEYVNSITLGSLAAQLAVAEGDAFWFTLIAVFVYGIFVVGSARLTEKSRAARRFLNGEPVVLMEHGRLYRSRFAQTNMDVEEFCSHLRELGYFDVTQVDSAVMETSGRISVLPRTAARPMTPADAKLPVSQELLCRNYIVDGAVLTGELRDAGHDSEWLLDLLHRRGITSERDVFLCCETASGSVAVYLTNGEVVHE